MSQDNLPGFEPPPREIHNLFFALWPDEPVRALISSVAESLHSSPVRRGRWIKPHRYHLTPAFLGEHAALPAALVERACAAAEGVRASAFDLVLDIAGSFGKTRIPGWLGCSAEPPALRALFEELSQALRTQGCRVRGGDRFVPHVTVLRDADQALRADLQTPVSWRVDEFVLIASRTLPPAPYRLLGRWQLR
jgi:2'-5' RNA ligase